MADSNTPTSPIAFETHPDKYRHWKLEVAPGSSVARLSLNVDESAPLRPGYPLKLNSYDLAVDIELADAVQRLRFEHPQVKSVIVTSSKDRIFCAGANIHMLAASTHPFKVNFCKYTNETRLSIEDASANSGIKFLAACNGPTAGGGYELALACDEILLIDDGSSTVSLPEVPLLAVLPGTGGLTRLVDKRKVRRDLADVFSTTAEGVRGKRAVEWKLVDASVPRSKFADATQERAHKLAQSVSTQKPGDAFVLDALAPNVSADKIAYRHVTLEMDRRARTATITVQAPSDTVTGLDAVLRAGVKLWALRAFRELDDAMLRLRFNEPEIGLVLFKSRGSAANVLASDAELGKHDHWFVREVRLHMARVLKRVEATAKSFFAVVDAESCFVGSLFELALCADRRYALDDPNHPIALQASALSGGALSTANGRTRLEVLGLDKSVLGQLTESAHDAQSAFELGVLTVIADDIDFEDTLRLAIEERASLSPDALTGMEASFRCIGPESTETKIFGRLSAWQNWIFTRPNAVGGTGALSLYGRPERPSFDYRRT